MTWDHFADKYTQSLDWTYLQTPQFSISTASDATMIRHVDLSVRNGALTEGSFGGYDSSKGPRTDLPEALKGRILHEVLAWNSFMETWRQGTDSTASGTDATKVGRWLRKMLPPAQIRGWNR